MSLGKIVSTFCGATACFCLTYVAPAEGQNYGMTDLGLPASGIWAEAHGINNRGEVVGTWSTGQPHYSQYAFLYANGVITDLGTISSGKGNSYDYAIAYAINNTNQIVGQGTTNSYNDYHAFLDTNNVMVDLDDTGQAWSSANAINNKGEIVGEFTTSLGLIHGFVYTNGGFLDIGTLSGGAYSSAKGVNDSGVVVGESSDFSGNTYAFVYSNGVMASLGTLGGDYSCAMAINNSGVIVGESSVSNGEVHAFVYRNRLMSDLGTFGGTNSTAQAINSGGEITGYALTTNEDAHAFLFNGSTMRDLHSAFVAPAGWTNVFLTLAYGINDSGQIAGAVNYVTNNGTTNYDAFLLTPPGLSLACSSNITMTASNFTGAVVSFSVMATGGCSVPTVTATPPSGSVFPIGTNTVNVTASDVCGHTDTCSFSVIVNPPVFSPIVLMCPTNISMPAAGSNGAVVSFAANATGGCDGPVVTSVPPSGSVFPIGTTTVTNVASDSCGDSTNGFFTVTVRPLPMPLSLASPAFATNHQFGMTFLGSVGQSFVVEASTDLVSWVPLFTNTMLGSATNWADVTSVTNDSRFYRTVTLP